LNPIQKEPASIAPAPPVDAAGDRLLPVFWWKPALTVGERARRRISLHLIPYLFFLYILAFLDRTNVSVAALQLGVSPSQGGLGFTKDIIGFGSGLFFWGYWFLEIPSTLSVERWGARWVFVRILVLWGICAALAGFIGLPLMTTLFAWIPALPEGPTYLGRAARFLNGLHQNPENQFYGLRFLLGFFEGGFFPSVIFYLSLWFRAEDRAKAIAGFMIAIPLANVIGMPLSGQLLKVHWFGLPGWRWIFILEGIAPILAGVATLFLLPDRPSRARWLPPDEREWLEGQLKAEEIGKRHRAPGSWFPHLGLVGLLTFVYFCLNVTSYGLNFFMPAIIKSQSHLSDSGASAVASLPYLCAFLAMVVNGWHSDRTRERPWHVAVPLALLGLGIWAAARCDGMGILPVLVMVLWVGPSLHAHLPAFWPIPTMFLGVTAAAGAIGFINMVGNLGGFVGPYLVGEKAEGQISFAPALMKLVPWPLAGAAVILFAGYCHRRMARRHASGREESA
jgi:ACS family tartrate transporter-like MFS transporter